MKSRRDGRLGAGVAERIRLGQTEVEDLYAAVSRQKDVLRLEIAVDNAASVGGTERVGDLRRDLDGPAPVERSELESLAQRLAFQQFGHDIERPALAAEVVDGEDVRV